MDAFYAAFGAYIQTIRKEKGLSQEEVAARSRISVQYLSGVENGHYNPSLKVIRKIALALGVSVKEMFSFPLAERVNRKAEPEGSEADAPRKWASCLHQFLHQRPEKSWHVVRRWA